MPNVEVPRVGTIHTIRQTHLIAVLPVSCSQQCVCCVAHYENDSGIKCKDLPDCEDEIGITLINWAFYKH